MALEIPTADRNEPWSGSLRQVEHDFHRSPSRRLTSPTMVLALLDRHLLDLGPADQRPPR